MTNALTRSNPLILRRDAILVTEQRFAGKPLVWGSCDCIRPIACHLNELGYLPKLNRMGPYSTAKAGYRRLKELGFDDVPQWLDSIAGLTRIPFARALPGDLIALTGGFDPSDEAPEGQRVSVVIHLGGDKMFGFSDPPPHTCGVMARDNLPLITWKADPCRS